MRRKAPTTCRRTSPRSRSTRAAVRAWAVLRAAVAAASRRMPAARRRSAASRTRSLVLNRRTDRHDAPGETGPEIVLDEGTLVARHRAQWDAQTARASEAELRSMRAALDREIDERSRPKLQAMLEAGDSQLITPDVSLPYHDTIDDTE